MRDSRIPATKDGPRRRVVGIGLIALLAPLALYFIFRTAALAVAPGVATSLPPQDLTLALRQALQVAAHPNMRVLPEMQQLAASGAVAAPLAFQPYFIAAKAAEQAGRLDRAILLMEEVRRRRPDFVLGRVQLLAYYQRAQLTEKLIGELDFLLRQSSEARQYIFPELVKMIANPKQRPLLAAVLARAPDWRNQFYQAAQEKPPAPQDLRQLITLVRRLRPLGDVASEQRLYLQALLNAGDFIGARAVALSFLPEDQRERHRLVFAPSFGGARGTPPFAWNTAEAANGNSRIIDEAADRGYLEVNYFGGTDLTLASQTLALSPGRYRIRLEAKSAQEISSGGLFWRIECLPGQLELVRLSLQKLKISYRQFSATFVVPAGKCQGQELRLIGEPGDISVAVNAQIRNLEVVRGE